MKIIINNEQTNNKDLEYEEGFWTGKKTIKYNRITLNKIKRNVYEYSEGETKELFQIKGNQILGITIEMFGNSVELLRKLENYEMFLSILILVPCLLFGAVGGAIGGILTFTNLTLIRNLEKTSLKIIISLQFFLLGILLSYIIACLILKMITPFM